MADAFIEHRHGDLVRDVARTIAKEAPRLSDLGEAELEKLARVVVAESLRDELKAAVQLEKIDYPSERARFLARASRTGSTHTTKAYRTALQRLEAWSSRQGVPVLELTPAQADDWIESEKGQGRAPSSVRLSVSGVSAFWTWLERRDAELRNPFRGTRSRPVNKPRRKLAVPTPQEIELLQAFAAPPLRAAIVAMARMGLRVGGLPGLSIYGERWTTTTKGQEQSGQVPDDVRKELERAGLPLRSPFAQLTASQIADRFRLLVGRLLKAGQVQERYSVHDLRHAFAVGLYQACHDVYQVKTALGHSSVSATERYLRSLGMGV